MNENTDLSLIQSKIHLLRGQRVMLDFDLAEFYGIETKKLKQAVRRNLDRFPADFLFELTREEYQFLRSQIVTLETGRGQYTKFNPFAFTEQGVAMLSSVLNSPKAIQINIAIMRAFVAVRQQAVWVAEIFEKLAAHDRGLDDLVEAIRWLGEQNQARHDEIRATRRLPDEWEERPRIGFKPIENQ